MRTRANVGALERLTVQVPQLDQSIMSIYVTLPSNGGGKEFAPTNLNSEYKVRLPERLKLKDEEWEVASASISLPTFDAVKRSILQKFPSTTKVGFKSGLLAYEEKNQPANPSSNPTQIRCTGSSPWRMS